MTSYQSFTAVDNYDMKSCVLVERHKIKQSRVLGAFRNSDLGAKQRLSAVF